MVLIAFVSLAAASAVVPLIAMLLRPQTQVTVISVDHAVPARALDTPAAAPLVGGDAVLARDTDLGTSLPAGAALSVDHPWRGVAASPGPYGVSAVWSDTELHVTRDDGLHFRQVLGGPGDIGGAAIDESGVVFAVRDGARLGVHASADQETWRALPFAGDTLVLTASDGWLGWLGLAHDSDRSSSVVLALSRDLGQTWRTQSVAEHADQALMRIDASGAVHMLLMVQSAAGPTMKRLRAHVDGRAVEPMDWPTDYADAWGLGHGGWAYAIASECATQDDDICAMGPERSVGMRTTGVRTAWDLLMGTNGQSTLAASGERLLRFDHDRATLVAEGIPAGISSIAVDGIDRVLAVVGQHLLRWSPKHGWRVLSTRDGETHYVR